MTANLEGPAADVEASPTDNARPLPPEWLIWAAAIEQQEDLRFRVTRGSERARFAEAVAQHRADGGVRDDWSEDAEDFVSGLRSGSDRAELHRHPRRWNFSRNRRNG